MKCYHRFDFDFGNQALSAQFYQPDYLKDDCHDIGQCEELHDLNNLFVLSSEDVLELSNYQSDLFMKQLEEKEISEPRFPSGAIGLDESVSRLPGVGESRRRRLEALGISNLVDLLLLKDQEKIRCLETRLPGLSFEALRTRARRSVRELFVYTVKYNVYKHMKDVVL